MNRVTSIDELPELDDLESPATRTHMMGQAINPDKIRESRYPGTEILPPDVTEKYEKVIRKPHIVPHESGMIPVHTEQHPPVYESYDTQAPKYAAQGPLSCIDVANHISSCPICSKLYNNDKTIYVIAIVILSIICILLLKKILDM